MKTNERLNRRDYIIFEDLKRFGFTTADHFIHRFNSTIIQAHKRFAKLKRKGYLKIHGRASENNRNIYVPGDEFFKHCPEESINRFNIANENHDLFILSLYGVLKTTRWGEDITPEQDFRRTNPARYPRLDCRWCVYG